MKVVVTGAAGFTGRVLVEKLLTEGHDVTGIDLAKNPFESNVKWIRGDIRQAKIPEADAIVHMAAIQYAGGTPDKKNRFYPVNVLGTKHVVMAAKHMGARLIFVSTDMVYGIPEYLPVDEDHPYAPIGWYGKSKLSAEHIITTNMENWVILRPRLITGPGRLGSLELAFELIEKGLPIPLPDGGKNIYQMVHVEDVADAIMLALEGPRGVYNLGSEHPHTMAELLKACDPNLKIVPFPSALVKIGLHLPGFPLRKEQALFATVDYYLDTSKAQDVLGWKPKHDDTNAMLEAYREYLRIKRKPSQQ